MAPSFRALLLRVWRLNCSSESCRELRVSCFCGLAPCASTPSRSERIAVQKRFKKKVIDGDPRRDHCNLYSARWYRLVARGKPHFRKRRCQENLAVQPSKHDLSLKNRKSDDGVTRKLLPLRRPHGSSMLIRTAWHQLCSREQRSANVGAGVVSQFSCVPSEVMRCRVVCFPVVTCLIIREGFSCRS